MSIQTGYIHWKIPESALLVQASHTVIRQPEIFVLFSLVWMKWMGDRNRLDTVYDFVVIVERLLARKLISSAALQANASCRSRRLSTFRT